MLAPEKITKLIDTSVKSLILAYGCGYVIRLLFEAHYGIMNLNPLQFSVALAGLAFFFYVGLAVAVLRAERSQFPITLRWTKARQELIATHSKRNGTLLLLEIGKWASFLFELDIAASIFTVLFGSQWSGTEHGQNILSKFHINVLHRSGTILIIFVALFYIISQTLVAKIPKTAAAYTTVFVALYIGIQIYVGGLAPRFLAWLMLVKCCSWVAEHTSLESDWNHRLAALTVGTALVFFYANSVYGRIAPQYGGGAQLPVVIRFEREVFPFPDVIGTARIIDQDADGFYLVPNKVADKPEIEVYVPKRDIRSIEVALP